MILKCPLIHPFLFPYGAINTTDSKLRKQEENLFEKIEVIMGQGFFLSSFNEIIDSKESLRKGFGLNGLNVARIAGVKYDA